MDRTSWIGVITCAILFFVWTWYSSKYMPARPLPSAPTATSSINGSTITPSTSPSNTTPSLTASSTESLKPTPLSTPEQTLTLENDLIRVTFTSHGGAIKQVELLRHLGKTREENVILHEHSPQPFIARTGWSETLENYTLEKRDEKLVAKTTLANGLQIERLYSLQNNYQIILQETLNNPNLQPIILPSFALSIGTGEPIHPHDQPTHLKAGWLARETDSYNSKPIASMNGGFFSAPKNEIAESVANLDWTATSNQFFASILKVSSDFKSTEMVWHKLELPKNREQVTPPLTAMYATVGFQGFTLNSQSSLNAKYEIYAGPKEYALLKNLPDYQSKIMDFSIWGWVIKPLLWIMHHIHRPLAHFGNPMTLNYGWVIVILTIFLKLCFWPLQSTANASMKKMQALAPRMEELKKKYENDAQKMNTEVMKLYKDYGVNPLGGCLPMLVQFPIFLGLYTMLQSAVEVRNESFFWVKDLAQPDTIYSFFALGYHVDINPLPLIMTATSILVMKMNPQSSDNPQMKMFQYMPLMFLFMLYNFASALSLYWTVNNALSMVQTYFNLKSPPPKLQRVKKKQMPFGLGNMPSK